MQGLFDTHTHLESFMRKGLLDEALELAHEAGVARLTSVGTSREDWDVYAGMAARYPQLEYTVGLHPCSVTEDWEKSVSLIEAYWSREAKPVALGEIGLDRYHLPKDEQSAERIFALQLSACEAQLALAKNLDAPVVIHSRGAFEECIELVDRSGVEWSSVVFHCFSEGPDEMRELMDRGAYGSFTGVVTFKNAHGVRAAAKLQGVERMMIETDAPYLAPVPKRGKPNQPAFLRFTAEFCADMFGIDLEEFAERTSAAAAAFYRLA